MTKLQIDIGNNSIHEQDKRLIEACVNSIITGRIDQLKLILENVDSKKRINPINKVHNALYKSCSDEQKTIWDYEINSLTDDDSWIASSFYTILTDADRESIKAAKISQSSNIASLGSCFATNISNHLKNLNYKNTYTLRIEEAANSPRLIDLYFNPHRVPLDQKEDWDNRFGIQSKHITEILPKIDLFILTFGVGWDLVDKDNNICLNLNSVKSRLSNGELKFDNPKPEKQSEHISNCIQSIRNLNSTAPILITLSPVPLSGFFGLKHVYLANSISKSSLLLAIEDARKKSDFIYIPTYEIITSLAPILFKEKIWGEDGTSRHPNNKLIKLICESFINLLQH
ncbi:GSCFA domain-containing protein [Limnohabitans sp. Rim8]|uniref:GSCFA domain-containing protein n=1 Tax=Limnohabitans sp. Rim8 TaxID=1100718 RepID=UPI0025F938A1|nr:GSCFA domain-containing protein [Limnohabitans sp. Rim8]